MNKMYTMMLIMFLCSGSAAARQIAITFDDAPTPAADAAAGQQRTHRLIENLRRAEVKQVLFFVTTKHIDSDSGKRLKAYVDAGHLLANHSHDHVSANERPANEVLLDAYQAHLQLKDFDNVLPLYRFPFLHHGADTQERETIRNGLSELGYSIGYVTVDDFDWYIDAKYQQALAAGKSINLDNLKNLYVETLWEAIMFYDTLARKHLGRSPKHVLLLHENDMAALFVGDLVKHIRAKGWKIISPQKAYKDAIGRVERDLAFTKQGRIAALAHEKGVPVEQLRHPSENTDFIDELFERYGVAE